MFQRFSNPDFNGFPRMLYCFSAISVPILPSGCLANSYFDHPRRRPFFENTDISSLFIFLLLSHAYFLSLLLFLQVRALYFLEGIMSQLPGNCRPGPGIFQGTKSIIINLCICVYFPPHSPLVTEK